MFAERWMHDLMIYLYVLSLLFAFSYLIRRNLNGERLSFYLLFSIWGLHTFALAFQSIGQFEPLFFYVWILISFALMIHHIYGMDVFVFCIYLIGFVVLAIYLFFVPSYERVQEQIILSNLIFVHVTLAWGAYAVFSLSGICAVLYLTTNHMLKRKKWNRLLKGLPSLDRLQNFASWLVMIGVLLLAVGMILGIIWGVQTLHSPFWIDLKLWSSTLVLIFYSFILYRCTVIKSNGSSIAWWNLCALFFLILNYLVSSSHLSFHHWV